jgi:hypothetical protein
MDRRSPGDDRPLGCAPNRLSRLVGKGLLGFQAYGPPFHGYVAHTDSMEAEIILTDGVGVVHALCTIQSSDLLHCEHRYGNGRVSNLFVLTRTGPGPKTLLPVPP